MKILFLLITFALIFGFRSVASFSIGGIIGYLLGNLLVLSGTGSWVIPLLTLVMAVALSKRIRSLLDNLFY